MRYSDFKGNDVDVSTWSAAKINGQLRSGRLIQIEEAATPAAPAKTTTAKKTARKTTSRRKTTKKQ